MPPNRGVDRRMEGLCLVLFAANLLLCVLLASFWLMRRLHHVPPSPSSFIDWFYPLWLTPYTAYLLLCAWNFAQPVPRWGITFILSLMMIPDELFAAAAYVDGISSEGKDLTMLLMLILLTPPKSVLAVLFASSAWRQFKQSRSRETSPTNPTGQIG